MYKRLKRNWEWDVTSFALALSAFLISCWKSFVSFFSCALAIGSYFWKQEEYIQNYMVIPIKCTYIYMCVSYEIHFINLFLFPKRLTIKPSVKKIHWVPSVLLNISIWRSRCVIHQSTVTQIHMKDKFTCNISDPELLSHNTQTSMW